ncbi:MAG: hypothetical protein ABSD98_12000 [Candidatus Korobacteraceae bacterium]|jgi:hypothetical protein
MAENEIPSKPDQEIPPTPGTPENEIPPTPSTPEAAPAQPPAYDEFGTAKRSLPPVAPVAIAIVLVAVVIGIIAYTQRAKPVAQGSIDGVWFSQPADLPSPMIVIAVTMRNVGEKTLYIKDLKASVKTEQGDQSDEAAAASDYDRYLMAYPDLAGHGRPLQVEMKIPPGAEQKGTVMVSVPITQQQFDARKDLTVTIDPYDQNPIVLHDQSSTAK